MKTAVLCPGPSLPLYPGRDGYDLVLGINRAATRYPCDVWVALDTPCVRDNLAKVIGTPLLVTGVESWGTLDTDNPRYPGLIVDQAQHLSSAPFEWNWTSFSCTSALCYAFHRGTKQIDLYGADWSGKQDFDGVLAGENRSDERWDSERGIVLNLLFPHFREQGVLCNRFVM